MLGSESDRIHTNILKHKNQTLYSTTLETQISPPSTCLAPPWRRPPTALIPQRSLPATPRLSSAASSPQSVTTLPHDGILLRFSIHVEMSETHHCNPAHLRRQIKRSKKCLPNPALPHCFRCAGIWEGNGNFIPELFLEGFLFLERGGKES
ncbi:hypothetical protein CEXT_337561 [Caerostris extrusa]|uniref:Uncharacterized protein n=1 Tax=Caerostris extrusa TaxID=172846 RepID=A0AAV4QHW9_CAEEX|nr:hypothetical protein CEXT_337561 [Caerostris extrusa]